jgi:hypothetical protein
MHPDRYVGIVLLNVAVLTGPAFVAENRFALTCFRSGENRDFLFAFTNIGDGNYRGTSWGLYAPGRSLSISYRIWL